jgi:hypothetical protein
MRKLLLAVLPAFLLTACAGSTRSTLSYSPTIPSVPAEAKKPCTATPMRRQPDGSANSADAEGSLRDARADLALCDVRRGLAVDASPR